MRLINRKFMLFVICVISVIVPATADWWEHGHFYQIYPRSFKDSDDDGLGDLNGITSKLEYLKNISVTGVWLSPIFASPMKDMGYDISDFREIHTEFGTMADFERLLTRCKQLDIKLILDFVPNHTSDQHEWFKISADPEHAQYEQYKDYYIWNSGSLLENGTRVPPSNWISIFGGSMWTWVESRQAFYMHQFLKEQPDLNFRNSQVLKEMKEVLRFWLRKGVSGFRIDAVPHLFEVEVNEDGLYDDEPISGQCNEDEYCYLTHTKTTHLNETFELIYKFRSVMDEDEFNDESRILMTEAYGTVPVMARYYGRVNKRGIITKYGAQIPFNFQLMSVSRYSEANEFKKDIEAWMNVMPKGVGIHANWVLGNHDGSRIGSRYGPEQIDTYNILIKTLPGVTVTYYGEEIGMTDVDVSNVDSDHRSVARTPFQWDNTISAGFSNNPNPWLPVAENYTECNVKLQESQEVSHLKVIQKLMSLRQTPTFKYGTLTVKTVRTSFETLLVYKRELQEEPDADIIVVVLRINPKIRTGYKFDLTNDFDDLPEKLRLHVSTNKIPSENDPIWYDTKTFELSAEPEGYVLVGSKSESSSGGDNIRLGVNISVIALCWAWALKILSNNNII